VTRQQRESLSASTITAADGNGEPEAASRGAPIVDSTKSRNLPSPRGPATAGSSRLTTATKSDQDAPLPKALSEEVDPERSGSSARALLIAGNEESEAPRPLAVPDELVRVSGHSASPSDQKESAAHPAKAPSAPDQKESAIHSTKAPLTTPTPAVAPAAPSTSAKPNTRQQNEAPAAPAASHARDSTPTAAAAAPAALPGQPVPLAISELRLCRRVLGFGSFEPWNDTSVKSGQRLLIYCEMTGVQYEPKDGAFLSRLSSRIEISAAGGGPVQWSHELGPAEDLCRRRRHDYYVNYRVDLPLSLAPGPYRLRLIQTDLVANKTTSAEIRLVVTP
jgi:hypothetical protein